MNKYKIYRINRDESDLNFVIRFPKGKTIADIIDVVFLVKDIDSTSLTEAHIHKLYSNSEITLTAPDIARVKFSVGDYNTLVIDQLYEAALFCKWDGDLDFDENVERLYDFEVEQNFHINN